MAFSINTNVASLESQQYLNISSAFQNQTIEEVTSGLRIVQSGDDAAGLAIANGFRSDEAVLTQGIQNANNGLSQLQIIDGGMDNISLLLDRASTLATESATGTFTGDRNVLNSEFQSVLTEINRQAQAIGLNTGGTFAKNLSVFIGGGQGPTGVAAIQNGTVSLNLSRSTIDTKSLGLEGVQASGVAGTDLGPGSETTSVADILANPANTTSSSGYTDFYISGPGFSAANRIQVQVNLSSVTDSGTLVTAVNDAIQNAGNATTQAATAFKNANITASIVTDAQGRQQLSFSSSSTAFQVDAGDEMANALMGNFGAKAAMTGATTGNFVTLSAADALQFSFNGGPLTSFSMAGTETDATDVAATLDANAAFTANAIAGTTTSGALTITSLNDTGGSTITVGSTNAATVLGLSGTVSVNPSTGKSLGESVTATLGATTTTATLAGAIVRVQGGGLASPVDITLAATDTDLALGVADLLTQVNNNTALQAVGIAASSSNGSTARYSYPRQRAFREPELGDLRGRKLPPIGIPWPSTTTMHFVPFPRRVFPTAQPPFSPAQRSRPEMASSEVEQQFRHPTGPATLATPAATPPALPTAADDASRCSHGDIRLAGRATVREHAEPRESFETAAIRCRRSAPSIFPSLRCREQMLNLLPLLVGQHHDNS